MRVRLSTEERVIFAGAFAAAIVYTFIALAGFVPMHSLWVVGGVTGVNIYLLRRQLG